MINSLANLVFPSTEEKGCNDGFGEAFAQLGETYPNVLGLSADVMTSTRAHHFGKKFPERFINFGVAEQNMVGVAAGLALSGKTPFVFAYGAFSPGRNWDQVRVSVCYSNTNVKIISSHVGLSAGPDGGTHQALEDLAITRVLPNLTVLTPCDYEQAKKMVKAVADWVGPVYLRYGRNKTPVFTTAQTPLEIGKALMLRDGSSVSIFATGPLTHKALEAAEELGGKEGIDCEVINIHTLKPLDIATVMVSARKTGAVVTVEEHQIIGGLHGAIAECLAQNYPVPIEAVGMNNAFGESGKPEELLEKYGMSVASIAQAVKRAIARKQKQNI